MRRGVMSCKRPLSNFTQRSLGHLVYKGYAPYVAGIHAFGVKNGLAFRLHPLHLAHADRYGLHSERGDL